MKYINSIENNTENLKLFLYIHKKVEQLERIDRAKAEKKRRQEILTSKNMFVEDFNETTINKNNKVIVKRKKYGSTN